MHVVIVGAGYAGLACALRLARRTHGTVRITLVNGRDQFIERIRLHERAAGRAAPALELREMLRGTDVELRIGWVEHIDFAAHTLSISGEQLRWDRLVLALGSTTDSASVRGVREHAYSLDAGSAAWLAPSLPVLAARSGRVLVVGGGLTAIETAAELAELHPALRVGLVTRGELAPGFSDKARVHTRATLTRLGVELHEHVAVHAVHERSLEHSAGVLPFDACLWAAGFVAAPLAQQLGLPVNERGQVRVDENLRTASHPHVYVAGDLATVGDSAFAPMPMGCKSALPSGLHVAENLAREWRGRAVRPFVYRAVPFCVSLGRADAILEFPGQQLEARRVWTGKFAANIKELICRGTVWALRVERRRAAPFGVRSKRSPLLAAESARV